MESLEVVEDGLGAYVYATVETSGASAQEATPVLLGRLVEELEWAKSQRWGSGDHTLSTARALDARAPRHRRHSRRIRRPDRRPPSRSATASSCKNPLSCLGRSSISRRWTRGKVAVDQQSRAAMLKEGIETVAAGIGGRAVVPEKTFAEVVNLVEWPTVVVGSFDEESLVGTTRDA